jgi:hypothetical protein
MAAPRCGRNSATCGSSGCREVFLAAPPRRAPMTRGRWSASSPRFREGLLDGGALAVFGAARPPQKPPAAAGGCRDPLPHGSLGRAAGTLHGSEGGGSVRGSRAGLRRKGEPGWLARGRGNPCAFPPTASAAEGPEGLAGAIHSLDGSPAVEGTLARSLRPRQPPRARRASPARYSARELVPAPAERVGREVPVEPRTPSNPRIRLS